jgi:hypothetical protein
MADEVPGLIDIVGFIGDAIGKGQSVLSFFQDSQPTMEDIAKAFAAEVQKIFATQLALEDIRKVTANLESARQFFAEDYQNAVNNGQTNDQLTTLINGSDGPGLGKLRANANLMNTWVGDPSLIDGGQATVNQAATLYLALQTFICTIHRELSRLSDDAKVKQTELDNAKSAAQDALTNMKDVLMKVLVARCQSLSVGRWYTTKVTGPPDRTSRNYFGATLVDSWLHGDGGYTLNTVADTPHDPSDGENAAMQSLIAPYQFMLWYGGPTAEAALTDAIAAAGLPGDSSSTFTSSDLQSLRDFGAWAVKVRTSLLSLDRIARGAWVDLPHQRMLGHAKHENWRYCSGCGAVYQFGPGYSFWQGTVQKICPVYGANHRSSGSFNYLVCSDATADPNGSQDGWAWCASCGGLHHDGAGDHCPFSDRRGPHMPRVSDSPTFHVMFGDNNDTDIQGGWRWCNKCAALHWPWGPSVCPSGGKHSTDGSGLYRLEYLGGWSPTLNGGEEFDTPRPS